MRVLHLCRDLAPESNGGLSIAVAGMLSALQGSNLKYAAWSFDSWRPKAKAGTTSAPSPAWTQEENQKTLRIRTPDQLEAASKLCSAWHPELLHVHHGMLWQEAKNIEIRLGRDLPKIFHLHVLQAEQERLRGQTESTMSSRAEAQALDEAQAIIAPSLATAQALLRHAPWVSTRLHVIGLGINTQPAARQAPGQEEESSILVAGRFADVKGTDLLGEILSEVLKRAPKTQVYLAGGCPENLRGQRRWLRRIEATLGPEKMARVRFLGWLSPEALNKAYDDASLLLSPSRFETFGQNVLEAMLHGLPVVAAQAGGLVELIEDGKSGLLCPVGDAQGMAEACLTLLAHPKKAQAMGRAGAQLAQKRDWSSVAQKLVRLYDALYQEAP